MRKLVALAALGLVFLFTSCDTKNVGGPYPSFGPQIASVTVVPAGGATGLFGLQQGTFTVTFAGGTAPYTIDFDYGGSTASANIVGAAATSPFTSTVTFVTLAAKTSFTASAIVTDAHGFKSVVNAASKVTFDVDKTQDLPPVINSITVSAAQVTVNVSDPDAGDVLTVTLNSATGGLVGAPGSAVADGSGNAVFNFGATDFLAGATGTANFTVDDGKGQNATQDSGTITIAPLVVPADAVAAIPEVASATTADTVKVVVLTGALAHPFQFMTGVSIVFPTGCDYDANSYDYGAPAAGDPGLNPAAPKDQDTIDGIWTTVNPTSGYLGVGDNLLAPDNALPAPFTGSSARDFNITPLGGSDAPAGTSGILFNFNLKFTAAGAYKLGFLLFDEVNRTYYQDSTQTVFQWGDLSNGLSQATVNVT